MQVMKIILLLWGDHKLWSVARFIFPVNQCFRAKCPQTFDSWMYMLLIYGEYHSALSNFKDGHNVFHCLNFCNEMSIMFIHLHTCERVKCGSLNMSVIHHWRFILSIEFVTLWYRPIHEDFVKGTSQTIQQFCYLFRHWAHKFNLSVQIQWSLYRGKLIIMFCILSTS